MALNSGSEKTRAMLQQLAGAFTAIPFNRMLGLRLDHLDLEHVTMSFMMKEELIGNFLYGILHGGVISSVIDMAGGMAAMANAIHNHVELSSEELVGIIGKCSTIDLHVNYLRPGRGERFSIKAWLTKSGKKIAFAQIELRNQDELLIATGTATYLLK